MNKSPDDEYVEKLLKGLPKAPPMSPLEVKRFEKQIDLLVAMEKEKTSKRNWIPRLSVAASIVALIAGIAVFSGGSETLKNTVPNVITPDSPGTETKSPSTGGGKPTPKASKENTDDGRTIYGQSSSPTPVVRKKSVPVLRSGFEYSSELSAAKKKILSQAVRGNLDSLSSAQLSCSIQLGVDESLWAIDEGTYMEENIDAYYFGESISGLKIKIVGNDCNLITDL